THHAPPTTALYSLSLHDALPISVAETVGGQGEEGAEGHRVPVDEEDALVVGVTRTHEEKSPMSPPASPPARLWQARPMNDPMPRSEEHTSELQSRFDLVCRLLLE